MRILWLKTDLLLPLDKGGRLRSWHLLRYLAKHHEVTYLSFADGENLEGMREVARRVETVPRSEAPKGSLRFYADVAVRFSHAGSGNRIDLTIPRGFGKSSHQKLLVLDGDAATSMRHNTITFRGPNLDAAIAAPGDYIDIGGTGLDATNTVTLVDTDATSSPATLQLSPRQNY